MATVTKRKSAAPPAPSKHQQRAEATRRALLESARKVFARDGFEACRIEDIAAGTGHTRGAFYAHFKTKEDLFFALLADEGHRRLEQLRAYLAPFATAGEKFAAIREYYSHHKSDRQWAMLMLEFKLYALRHPELRPQLAEAHRATRASLNYEGVIGAGDEAVRAALESFITGLTIEHAYDPRRLSRAQMSDMLGVVFDALYSRL